MTNMCNRTLSAATLILIIAASPCLAQKQGEEANSRISWSIQDRAVKFLKTIAELSPLPASADPDKAQRWPRRPEFVYKDPNSPNTLSSPRKVVSTVNGAYLFRPELSRPSWNIKIFQDGINMLIEPVSNSIIGFSDDVVARAIGLDKLAGADKEISQASALARAQKYLEATGMDTDEYILESIKLRELKVDPTPNERRWSLVFGRYSNGVPFNRQELYVELDAEKGRLLELSCRNGLELPAVNRVRVDKAKAIAAAKLYVENQGEPATNTPSISLQIIQPDENEVLDNGETAGYDRKTQLAWIVRLPITGASGLRQSYEVAVSAATGAIIHAKRSSALVDIATADMNGWQTMTANLSQAKEIQFVADDTKPSDTWIDCDANARAYYGSLAVLRSVTETAPAANSKTERPTKLNLKMTDGKIIAYLFYEVSFIISDGKGNFLQSGSAFQHIKDLQK